MRSEDSLVPSRSGSDRNCRPPLNRYLDEEFSQKFVGSNKTMGGGK